MIEVMSKKEIADLKRLFKNVHAEGLRVYRGDQSVIFRDMDSSNIQIYEIEIPQGNFEFVDQNDIFTKHPYDHDYAQCDDIIKYLDGKIEAIPLYDDIREHKADSDKVYTILNRDLDDQPFVSLNKSEIKSFRDITKGFILIDDNLGYIRIRTCDLLTHGIEFAADNNDSLTGYDSNFHGRRLLPWNIFNDETQQQIKMRVSVERLHDISEIFISADSANIYLDTDDSKPVFFECNKRGSFKFKSCLAPAPDHDDET